MGSAKSSIKLDQRIADILQTAIESALRDMFDISVRCGAATIGREPFAEGPYVVSVIDMIEADELCGIFVVAFSFEAVHRILTTCNIHQTDDPAIVHDAVAEITNVIYGEIKKLFNQMGHSFVLKLPQTIPGKTFFHKYRDSQKLVLPFSADGCLCHAAIMIRD